MSESVKVEALKTTQWWHYNSFFLAAADAAVSAVSAVVKISPIINYKIVGQTTANTNVQSTDFSNRCSFCYCIDVGVVSSTPCPGHL